MKDHLFVAMNAPAWDPSKIIGLFTTLEAAQAAAVDFWGGGHDLVVKEYAGTERVRAWAPKERWIKGGLVSQGIIEWMDPDDD